MTVLTFKPRPTQTPQCCALPRDGRCRRESVVEISGNHYCRAHAGGMTLDMWLSGQLVEPHT